MVTLGDKAMDRVDDALRHERAQAVVKRVDATLTEIGDRIRGEQTESPANVPPSEASPSATGSDEPGAQAAEAAPPADVTAAEVVEPAAPCDAEPASGGVSPDISADGEDKTPTKTA